MRTSLLLLCLLPALALSAYAETYTLTLKQAVDRATAQNPDTVMARLDELRATQAVKVAQSPFKPRVGAGSGLAYSNGFPLSIEGSAPAAFEVKANQYLFNRPQTWAIEQAKESARGAAFGVAEKGEEATYRVATLYVDVARAGKLADAAKKQIESLEKVLSTAQARVEEGRELPLVAQQARVNLLRAQQRSVTLEIDRDFARRSLAVTLGYSAGDLVSPVDEESAPPRIPTTEDAAVQAAISSSKELKRLESNVVAKGLEIRSDRAQVLPRVDLVAQYALLTKYSHYDEYFARFQRHNGQIGASIQVPLFTSASVRAVVAEAETERRHMQTEVQAARNKIALDVHQSYQEVQKAEIARQLAQADLDLARSQLSVVLALLDEGRATLSQVEEARFAEDEKWIAFYDAQFGIERARLAVLRQTGELRAALQ